MRPDPRDVLIDFRTRFEQSGGDLRIDAYLRERGLSDDDIIADLIAADARLRRERGVAVRLDDYLSAMPDLATRTIPLDAAVEASLRAALDGGATTIEAVDRLSEEHPALRTLIQEAAVLGRLLPTDTIGRDDDGPTFQPGDEIGEPMEDGRRRYLIRERLGAGVQGEVHLATDRRLSGEAGESLVAIKALRRLNDDDTRRRFIEEAARARRIDHPNVVRALDRGVHDGREFIVFDYVSGGTLEEYVRARGGRLPMREAARLSSAIARGVQAAHAAGLVHGDLKPGNILLTDSGEPKVADFGVAALHRPDQDEDRPDGLQGNLAFMAPEQFRMEGGARSPLIDTYALGGILYWAINGRPPRGSSLADIVASHRANEGQAKEGDIPDVDLDLVVRRALSHAPKDRQSAAGSLADDLDAWLERRPIGWTRPPASHRFRLWLRRQPATALAISALLMMTGISVWLALSSDRRASELNSSLATATEALDMETRARGQMEAMAAHSMNETKIVDQMTLRTADLYDIWSIELYLRRMFPDSESVGAAWTAGRNAMVDAHIALAVSEGSMLRAALLRAVAGRFALQDGQFDDAVALLTQSRDALAEMLPATDTTRRAVETVHAAARAHAIALAGEAEQRAAARTLEGGRTLFTYDDDQVIRTALDDALRLLYGPDMLNDPARLAALNDEAAPADAPTPTPSP
ncbi:MAG: serine/threonine-protein kinase [Phycisphaerales bacterium]